MTEALPSNRKFGLTFCVVFAVLTGLLWWKGNAWYPAAAAASVAFLAAAMWFPFVLRPLNRAWMALAALLHKVMSPIILGVLFFVLFTPVALFMRFKKRDVMKRRFERSAGSYWIPRSPAGPAPESLRDQF